MSSLKLGFLGVMILAGLVIGGCTNQDQLAGDPKQRLRDYISKSFAVSSLDGRKELLEFLGGDARSRLSAWSEDQFRTAFIESKRQFVRLSFTDVKQVSPREVSITYELVFMDQSKSPNNQPRDAKVTNRKLCQMTLDGGKWYIQDVRNIKELVEYRNAMEISLGP